MKNVLFIAPPAGGKGTVSDALVENFGYIHISTGDLLRELDKSTELGREVDELLKTGKFIDDEIVLRLLKDKLATVKGVPFILDGCPRNLTQAEKCDEMLKELGLSLDAVILLDVPYDTILKRALGRVNCPSCKTTFNTFFKKPLKEGVCDKCGDELMHRKDDNEESFKVRFDTYTEVTEPIKEFYKEKGIFHVVDGTEGTYESVVGVLKK